MPAPRQPAVPETRVHHYRLWCLSNCNMIAHLAPNDLPLPTLNLSLT
jgi:hypothetical protein